MDGIKEQSQVGCPVNSRDPEQGFACLKPIGVVAEPLVERMRPLPSADFARHTRSPPAAWARPKSRDGRRACRRAASSGPAAKSRAQVLGALGVETASTLPAQMSYDSNPAGQSLFRVC
jgi:hypothetical protein